MSEEPDCPKNEQLDVMRQLLDLAVERTKLAQERTRTAAERTKMSAERSRMSAERSYMSSERTLSVWVRTALTLMIFGIAIDRFELLLQRGSGQTGNPIHPGVLSNWGGVALVALGVLMVLAAGVRFWLYARAFCHTRGAPRQGPFLALAFAGSVALVGIALLILLLFLAE